MRVIVVMFLLASVAGTEAGSTLKALADHLALPKSKRPPLIQQPFAKVTLTKADAIQAQQLLWACATFLSLSTSVNVMVASIATRLLLVGRLNSPTSTKLIRMVMSTMCKFTPVSAIG